MSRYGLPAAIALLLASNVWLSHVHGQDRTMYTNPIYRWRESLAIALSRLQDKPLHGYLAYRSIQRHLAGNGLGLISGEADPLPTGQQLKEFIEDPGRLGTLIREAARVPIDESLPPVRIAGSEKGLADYYYWAFRLFGITLQAPWRLYFLLLSLSVLVFLLTFRRSPFGLYLLCLYLIGHIFMVTYANHGYIQTIHNSRFFPVLAFLPTIHLLLLMAQRVRPSAWVVAGAAAQTFLLFFIVFCRIAALWQVVALLASIVLIVTPRVVLDLWRRPAGRGPAAMALARAAWPVIVVGVGCVVFALHFFLAQDRKAYGAETRTHVFWHPLFSGMVSASPQLMTLYSEGEEGYSDGIVYMAVRADLRRRQEATSPVAYVHNGAIEIDIMRSMGEYDRLVRRLFFAVVAEHPFLVLKSFVYDKPRDQLVIFWWGNLYDPRRYWVVVVLAVGAAFLYFSTGAPRPRREDLAAAKPFLWLVFACSLTPTMVVPTPLIVDSILFYLMVALLAATFLPVAALGGRLDRRDARQPRTEP